MATSADLFALAAQYHATGNVTLAEQYAASVLEEEPNHAEALQLLGLIAQQKGKPAEALAYLNRALTVNGSNAAAWQQAGDILLATGDVPGGITYYEQALRLRPDFAEGYNTLGLALQRVGNRARAIESFQRATRLAPSFVPALNNLGAALQHQGHWKEAAAAYEKALDLWPENPDVAFNLGNTRFDLGDLKEAVACYRRALRLQPAYAAEVSNSLATALKKQGLWEEAVAQYQETLRLRPGHGMAIFNLSELASEGRYVFPPEDLAQVKDDLASERIGEAERVLCAFAVGKVLHRQGAFDEAFRYFQEANDLQLRLFKKRNAAFDARAHQATINRLIDDHGPAYFEMVKEWGTSTEVPVFIVGMPFSGAAQVEEVLASHPKVSREGNAVSVVRFLLQSGLGRINATNTLQLLPNMYVARTAAANYLTYLTERGQGADRVLINSLDNATSLGLIATLFPGARVIHCRREPLDVALACYFQNRRDLTFGFSLEDIAAYCLAHEKLMAHWARVLPLTIHDVKFEDLLNDREGTARALIAYSGLDWNDRCANSNASAPSALEMIGLAKQYRAHLGPLVSALEG
jgi:tetratricopeptide (TPR) repeat protein